MASEATPQDICHPATWMKRTLIVAAIYNIVWGTFAILSPQALFRWLCIEPLPIYPEFWQCIGMIIGVYGIGYAIAASDPYRHWPIVLVGLLGKMFGPVGFAIAVWQGTLPLALGWTIITNDLVWWAPFTLILWNAVRAHQCSPEQLSLPVQRTPIDPLGRMLSQYGASITELSHQQPLLLVLLRHSGCTFCREALSDLAAQRAEIEAAGTGIAIVHLGRSEPRELLERHGLSDLHCFQDPMGHLYDLFGLRLGSFSQLFGTKTFLRGTKALFSGHGFGKLEGNVFRMPGVFLIYRGEPLRAFRHHSAADRPDYVALATMPDKIIPAREHTAGEAR